MIRTTNNPPGVDAVLSQFVVLTRLLAHANPWPGWSPLARPTLLTLGEGANLLIGVAKAPHGFRAVEPPPNLPMPADLLGVAMWCRAGFVDAQPLVGGTLVGSHRAAHLGANLTVPAVNVIAGKDKLVEVGILARNLFRAQVTAQLAADLDVRAGIGEDELDELLNETAESRNAPTEEARVIAFLLELQRAYEHYPETALLNNVLGNLEGRLLYGHLVGDGFADRLSEVAGRPPAESLARALALARRDRYGTGIPPSQVAFERRMEVYEGLPRFLEMGVFKAAAAAPEELIHDQAATAHRLLAARGGLLPQVNQRGWGASRRRFYHTGMALAFLLEDAVPGWREDLTRARQPLDRIIEGTVEYDGGVVDEQVLEAARLHYGYHDRLEDERTWTRDIDSRRRGALAAIMEAPGTRVSVDVSALEECSTWIDPATVERIGESILVHVRPGVFTYGDGGTFVEFRGLSVVEDQRSRLLHTNLPGPAPVISGDDHALTMIKGVEFTEGLEVELGGLKIRARSGRVVRDGQVLFIKLLS